MLNLLEDTLQMGVIELVYAFVLTLFIFLTGYFYKQYRDYREALKHLQYKLEEAELDRASFVANSTIEPQEPSYEQSAITSDTSTKNTILEQELENYLLREEEKAADAKQNFMELSADFVDFLKMKSGKIKLKERAFTLNDMFDDLAKSLRSQMARTKVEFIFDIDTKVPPKLIGDKRHIRLLLFNLISNIIHHRTDTQIVLRASSVNEGNALKLIFRVANCMLTEKSEEMDSIFVPFSDSRFDESMQIEFYIARELARMMRGDISFECDDVGRSELKIELLLSEENPEDKRFYRLPSRSMIGHKILIVNENRKLAESIQNMYEYFQNEVTLLRSSEFASQPEIISEYHTVVIDKDALGLSLVEKVRAVKRAQKVNVVALLHAKDEVDYKIPLGAVDQLLIKPITIQNVFNTIIALEERQELGEMSDSFEKSVESQFKGEANKKIFEDFYGKRILLIEKERDNQKMLFTLLRRSGVNLTLAQSTQESLWMLEKMSVFDIILVSREINSESTLPFSQKIRTFNRYKGVPIVIMSKETFDTDNSGADQWITKPVQARALFTLFNHYLSKEEMTEESKQYISARGFINTVSLAARDGFEMASFDEALYSDILQEFVTQYSDSSQRMNAILVKDDLRSLKQICLDVKGVTANIGALRLSSITAQIHSAISKGQPKDLMALMNQYQPELERVKKEIQAYLK